MQGVQASKISPLMGVGGAADYDLKQR